MYCIAGCLIELNQDVNNGNITDIDSSVIISNPDITYIGSHHHLIYMINMTKPFNSNSSHELRVAMVIEITDTNTSAVHYQWKVFKYTMQIHTCNLNIFVYSQAC